MKWAHPISFAAHILLFFFGTALSPSTYADPPPVDSILQEFLDIGQAMQEVYLLFTNPTEIAQLESQVADLNAQLSQAPAKVTAKLGDNLAIDISELTTVRDALLKSKVTTLSSLSYYYVIDGYLDKAIAAITEASTLAQDLSLTPSELEQLTVNRGIAYLRKAEQDNCVTSNNSECCVFPLTGGGVHQATAAAEASRESFLELLQRNPNDTRAKWVLNVLAMALGDFPDAVDPSYRIPPSVLTSSYDIGIFHNVAKTAGVDVFGLAGGAISIDYNNDGFYDIAASSWGGFDPLELFRNNGNGTFSNISKSAGVSNQLGGLQINITDYNNDGFEDIFILRGAWIYSYGQIRNSLLRNNTDGTFTDVTLASGLAFPAYPTQAGAWGDFDNDGHLDIVIGNEGQLGGYDYPSQLFRNNGDGTFTDIAASAGINIIANVKGICIGDYNNDRYLDIFTSTIDGESHLFRNNGDLTFTNVAAAAGVVGTKSGNHPGSDFPCWFFDYNNDGWLDIFIAPFATTIENVYNDYMGIPQIFRKARLYRNNGDSTFSNVTDSLNLNHPYLTMGATFGDLDNDGWLDVFLTTGDPFFTSLMPNIMLRNNQAQTFQDVTFSGGFGNLQKGHGPTFCDFNNDGTQDIYHVLGGAFESDRYFNALYANPGHGNHFLEIKLRGVESNKAAYGTRIKVVLNTPGGTREIHRSVGSVSSFGNTPFRMEIGLGDATSISQVDIWWPKTGQHQLLNGVPLDSFIEVTEAQPGFTQKPLVSFQFNVQAQAADSFLKVAAP